MTNDEMVVGATHYGEFDFCNTDEIFSTMRSWPKLSFQVVYPNPLGWPEVRVSGAEQDVIEFAVREFEIEPNDIHLVVHAFHLPNDERTK